MRSSKSRSRSKSNRSRSMGNIVNRVFDSSGPEGKVRGTPQQIIEKYTQLARDAHLGNDRVAAENFQQHAEHYTRMLGAAQREMEMRQGGGEGSGDGTGNANAQGSAQANGQAGAHAGAQALAQASAGANGPVADAAPGSGPAPSGGDGDAGVPDRGDAPAAGGEPAGSVQDADRASTLVETPEGAPKPRRPRARRPRTDKGAPGEATAGDGPRPAQAGTPDAAE